MLNPGSAQPQPGAPHTWCVALGRESPVPAFLTPTHTYIRTEIQEQGFVQATGERDKIVYKTEAKCKRNTDLIFR